MQTSMVGRGAGALITVSGWSISDTDLWGAAAKPKTYAGAIGAPASPFSSAIESISATFALSASSLAFRVPVLGWKKTTSVCFVGAEVGEIVGD
jgi:hypothetical protein